MRLSLQVRGAQHAASRSVHAVAPSTGHRGLWMGIGALVVVLVLVGAGIAVPHFLHSHAATGSTDVAAARSVAYPGAQSSDASIECTPKPQLRRKRDSKPGNSAVFSRDGRDQKTEPATHLRPASRQLRRPATRRQPRPKPWSSRFRNRPVPRKRTWIRPTSEWYNCSARAGAVQNTVNRLRAARWNRVAWGCGRIWLRR